MDILITRFLTNEETVLYSVQNDGYTVPREMFALSPKESNLWTWKEVCHYVWYWSHETNVTVTVRYKKG
jgi:hypothetical protein